MEATNYVNSVVSDLHSQTLASVVDILLKNPNLTSDQKSRLETGSLNVSYGYRSQVDVFKENLEHLWSSYVVPTKTLEDCIGEYNAKRMEVMQEHFRSESFNVSNARKNNTPYIPLPQPYFPEYEKPYCRIGNKFKAISLTTGNTVEECLLNPLDFQISDLQECILINTHDKSLNILESTRLILQYGQNVGLGKDKVASLLKSMIRTYSPQHVGIFSFISSPSDVFHAVISMVNYSSQMNSIKQAIGRIQRGVGEAIETPIHKYMSLLLNASYLEQPTMSNEQAVDKAHKKAIFAINFLIEDNAKEQLERMKQEEYVRLNRKASLDDVMKFVVNIELDPRYQLQTIKTLAGKPVNFSLYHTDTMRGLMVDGQQEYHAVAPGLEDSVNYPKPEPHIQVHGHGNSQYFYGGLHQHGEGPLRPMRALQHRQEYLPRHSDAPQQGDVHLHQRLHQQPHDQQHQHGISYQQPHVQHQQRAGSYQQPRDHHHQQHHDQHNYSHHQPHQNTIQHQSEHEAQPQHDDSQQYYQDASEHQQEHDGPPTPPDIHEAGHGQYVPDVFYQHRNGDFSKLDLRSLWYKDYWGNMCCLDQAFYQRRRSPSPDSDIHPNKQTLPSTQGHVKTDQNKKTNTHK